MPVTAEQVRTALSPEEPDYRSAATLGPDALPHLRAMLQSGDAMLAQRAAFLAGMIGGEDGAAIVKEAAESTVDTVRVAAASAARHLDETDAVPVLEKLLDDADGGIRKVALRSVTPQTMRRLRTKVERIKQEDESTTLREKAGEILSRYGD